MLLADGTETLRTRCRNRARTTRTRRASAKKQLWTPNVFCSRRAALFRRFLANDPATESLISLIQTSCDVALIASPVSATPLMSSHSASTIWNTSAGSHW